MTGRFDGDLAGTFDAIATRAADGMSRRQVAKLAIGMALSSAVPSWLLAPDLASAGKIGKEGDCPTPQAGSCPSGSLGYTKNCAHKVPNGQASFYNGCGPAAGIDLLGLAKVEPPDTPFDLAHFADACNGHDCCYGRCGADKDECDSNFRHGMHEACSKETNALLDAIGAIYCHSFAEAYYLAVSKGGADAFEAGQAEVCDCCCGCPEGQHCCGDDHHCVDTNSDLHNCGACGLDCTTYAPVNPQCIQGQCTGCTEGTTQCPCAPGSDPPQHGSCDAEPRNYYCATPMTDDYNCGACGNECGCQPNGPDTCIVGHCQCGQCVYEPGATTCCPC